MVLESILSAKAIRNRPWYMFILSIVVSLLCVLVSHIVFPEYAGVITPLLITIAMAPLFYRIFAIEEELEREEAEHKIDVSFWNRHGETILIFTMFFFGNLLSILLLAIMLPIETVNSLFSAQLTTIASISGVTAALISQSVLEKILVNNLKVMFFSFLLSFVLGTGALYILSWNASVLAIYLATFINKGLLAEFVVQSVGIIPHAPFEILGYFLAGIAGGILSVGIMREHIKSKEFILVFKDSLILLGIGILAIFVGGFLEVYL